MSGQIYCLPVLLAMVLVQRETGSIAGLRAIPFNPVKRGKLYRKKCIAGNSPLIDEKPILLNPEIDDPEDYLTFESDGYLKEIPDDLNRGKITIKIFLKMYEYKT